MPWTETDPVTERQKFVRLVLKGQVTMTQACQEFGISRPGRGRSLCPLFPDTLGMPLRSGKRPRARSKSTTAKARGEPLRGGGCRCRDSWPSRPLAPRRRTAPPHA